MTGKPVGSFNLRAPTLEAFCAGIGMARPVHMHVRLINWYFDCSCSILTTKPPSCLGSPESDEDGDFRYEMQGCSLAEVIRRRKGSN